MDRHLALAAGFLVACGACGTTAGPGAPGSPGAGGADAGSNVASEDERGSVGVPNPASEYCRGLGYAEKESDCVFPDGTSCEQWSFWRGECGEEHSYCVLHGGELTAEERDMGGWTALVAVCTVDGVSCKEDDFWRTGRCE